MTQENTTSTAVTKRTGFSKALFEILTDWSKLQMAGSLLIVLLGYLSPLLIKSPYDLNMVVMTALFALAGLGWNIIGGFAGQLFIGFVSFFGVGAYTAMALLVNEGISAYYGILLGGLVAAFLGLLVALLTTRYGLKSDYLALFTVALFFMLGLAVTRFKYIGGASGLYLSFQQEMPSKMVYFQKESYLYVVMTMLLIGVIIHYLVHQSKLGRFLMAIREDEDAAAALGVNIARYKTYAILLGSAFGGVVGGFYAIYTNYISPPLVFSFSLNVEMLIGTILGGRGTIIGPLLGTMLNKPSSEMLRSALSGEIGLTLIGYGLFLMVFIIFLPSGIVGLIEKPYERFRRNLIERWK